MDSKILQDVGLVERTGILRNTAVKSEEMTYPRGLGEKELAHLKDEYFKKRLAMAKLDEHKKEYMAEYKAEYKPLEIDAQDMMTKLRTKVEEITEDVYLMPAHEEGMMGFYNKAGELVYQRPLLPEERQFSIIDNSAQREGTNNQ